MPAIGIHTDWRRRFDDEVVNLMIEESLDRLVRSEDELRAALAVLPRGVRLRVTGRFV